MMLIAIFRTDSGLESWSGTLTYTLGQGAGKHFYSSILNFWNLFIELVTLDSSISWCDFSIFQYWDIGIISQRFPSFKVYYPPTPLWLPSDKTWKEILRPIMFNIYIYIFFLYEHIFSYKILTKKFDLILIP